MKNLPLISIIIPIYNVEQYIPKCLDSILAQNYPHLEIILIDDGSTDSSGSICDAYGLKDSRFHVLHQENQGISVARNNGIAHSRGEYIFFLDSDDYIHPQTISILWQEFQNNDVDLVCCTIKRIKDDATFSTNTINKADYSVTLYDNYTAFYEIYTEKYVSMIVCWNKLYPRNLVTSILFPEGRIHEDEFFSPRALSIVKKVAVIDYPLYYYVKRPKSIMAQSITEKSLDKIWAMEQNINYFKETNQTDKSNLESIRCLDYCISLCVSFKTDSLNNTKIESLLRNHFEEVYGTMNIKTISLFKRSKYFAFRKLYSLFIWEEIHFKKLKKLIKH